MGRSKTFLPSLSSWENTPSSFRIQPSCKPSSKSFFYPSRKSFDHCLSVVWSLHWTGAASSLTFLSLKLELWSTTSRGYLFIYCSAMDQTTCQSGFLPLGAMKLTTDIVKLWWVGGWVRINNWKILQGWSELRGCLSFLYPPKFP